MIPFFFLVSRRKVGEIIPGIPPNPLIGGCPRTPLPGFKYLIPDNPALIRGRISPGSYEETFFKTLPPKGISKVVHEVIPFFFLVSRRKVGEIIPEIPPGIQILNRRGNPPPSPGIQILNRRGNPPPSPGIQILNRPGNPPRTPGDSNT